MRSRSAESSFARKRRPHALVRLHRELEVLEHRVVARTPWASGTCGRCRRRAISGSDRRVRSIDLPEERGARVGPRLAGDHVHHRRLAGAVGADDAAQLAGVDREREIVQRLEAVEADRDADRDRGSTPWRRVDAFAMRRRAPSLRRCARRATRVIRRAVSSSCGSSLLCARSRARRRRAAGTA